MPLKYFNTELDEICLLNNKIRSDSVGDCDVSKDIANVSYFEEILDLIYVDS